MGLESWIFTLSSPIGELLTVRSWSLVVILFTSSIVQEWDCDVQNAAGIENGCILLLLVAMDMVFWYNDSALLRLLLCYYMNPFLFRPVSILPHMNGKPIYGKIGRVRTFYEYSIQVQSLLISSTGCRTCTCLVRKLTRSEVRFLPYDATHACVLHWSSSSEALLSLFHAKNPRKIIISSSSSHYHNIQWVWWSKIGNECWLIPLKSLISNGYVI